MQKRLFSETIDTEAALRDIIGTPSQLVNNKVISYLDSHCQQFIADSPFFVLSTADRFGNCDVSPRGDAPGSVLVLNEQQFVMAERPGNRRADSLRNIIENPRIGLLFMIPGLGETLRINGKAVIVQDEDILDRLAYGEKRPLLGIAVEVEECYIHCAKAFKRSQLWDPEAWPEREKLPNPAKIILDHSNSLNSSVEEIDARLQEGYRERLY